MAKTFYKYVAQDQEARVDWNEVARDFTDSLKEESEDRQRRKDELKKAHDETLKSLQQPPQGDNQTLNASIQGFANSAMKQSTLMYDLLTSGQLKPRDYKISMQNLADDSQGLYDVWTQYSEDYDKMLKRQQSIDGKDPEGAKIEGYTWKGMEFFSNFKNYKPTIDPNSGRVYYAKVDKDGNVSTNPNDRASIIDLRSRLRTKYDNVDVNTLTTQVTDQVGKYVYEKLLSGEKGVTSLDDPKGDEGSERRKMYNEYRTNQINAMMINPISNATILTNHIATLDVNGEQKAYDFTWDPAEAKVNPNLILLKKNPDGSGQPDPQLTDTQKKSVQEYLETRVDIKIDEIHKIREHYKPKNFGGYNATRAWKMKQEAAATPFDYIVQLAGSKNVNEKQAALSALSSLIVQNTINGQKVSGFNYEKFGDNFKIKYENNGGQVKTITITPSMNLDNVIDNMLYDFVPSSFDLNYAKNRDTYKKYQSADVLENMKDAGGGSATGIKNVSTTAINKMTPDQLQSRLASIDDDITRVTTNKKAANEAASKVRLAELRKMRKQVESAITNKGGNAKAKPVKVPKPSKK